MIATRIARLAPSPTLALDAAVKRLQASGVSIINCTVGEPYFDTPAHIAAAAVTAIKRGATHYTPSNGIAELRAAIAKKLWRDNHLRYTPAEIVVGVGSKQLLAAAFQTVCNPGDQVLLATPTWTTYIEQIKLAGGRPVLLPLASPWRLKAADVAARLTKKSRLLLLNSPANPTGAVIAPGELKKIAVLAIKHRLTVISDEIYEKLLYAGRHVSIASFNKTIQAHTITINGLSKAYAMTGWRVGYAAGPVEIIAGMSALASQTTSGTSSISQWAAVAALHGSQQPVRRMQHQLAAQRQLLYRAVSQLPGVRCTPPDGAFYLFVDVRKLLTQRCPTSTAWATQLLQHAGVAVVPGEAFAAPGFVRISYAIPPAELRRAITRLQTFLQP